ncbi:MAG: 4-(cytidine 5'-diphospho)-2-C-methyl-D-erythritol kinase [Desulfobacteraceae bacterium]|nr:4-(cytidine 5'-diphospho)-2-C-methyl-D-erythritol kinase [Desulfobacteraceae bacterium]
MRELEISAPAKVNLFLRVLRRREDGYHDLVSVMQKLSLADRLQISLKGRGIRLDCPGSPLPEDASNLAFKAAALFYERTGIAPGLRLTLHKRIPLAAGLGGGSSDAAAVLRGANLLHGQPLKEAELLALGAALGADVPFFVADGSTALATGTGTELAPIEGPRGYQLLLVNPGLPVSTAWVYSNLGLTTSDDPYKLRGYSSWKEHAAAVLAQGFSPEAEGGLYNDLEAVTIARYPVIGAIKERLLGAGAASALMSGSGATVFGVFHDPVLAEQAHETCQRLYAEVFLTSPAD